jgi:hypothetical protein
MKTLMKLFFAFAVALSCVNMSYAQTSKKEKQNAKEAEIKKLVDDQNYVFKANFANPQRGGSRALDFDYDLVVSKDTINTFLPYFGRAYTAPINPSDDGGIKFVSTNFVYKTQSNKKGGWDIDIKPKEQNSNDMRSVQSLRLSVTTSGYATLYVTSSNRDPISFDGYIQGRDKK